MTPLQGSQIRDCSDCNHLTAFVSFHDLSLTLRRYWVLHFSKNILTYPCSIDVFELQGFQATTLEPIFLSWCQKFIFGSSSLITPVFNTKPAKMHRTSPWVTLVLRVDFGPPCLGHSLSLDLQCSMRFLHCSEVEAASSVIHASKRQFLQMLLKLRKAPWHTMTMPYPHWKRAVFVEIPTTIITFWSSTCRGFNHWYLVVVFSQPLECKVTLAWGHQTRKTSYIDARLMMQVVSTCNAKLHKLHQCLSMKHRTLDPNDDEKNGTDLRAEQMACSDLGMFGPMVMKHTHHNTLHTHIIYVYTVTVFACAMYSVY